MNAHQRAAGDTVQKARGVQAPIGEEGCLDAGWCNEAQTVRFARGIVPDALRCRRSNGGHNGRLAGTLIGTMRT